VFPKSQEILSSNKLWNELAASVVASYLSRHLRRVSLHLQYEWDITVAQHLATAALPQTSDLFAVVKLNLFTVIF